jgi:hypothetical protein
VRTIPQLKCFQITDPHLTANLDSTKTELSFPSTSFPERHPRELQGLEVDRLESDRKKAAATIFNVRGGISLQLLISLFIEKTGILILLGFVPTNDLTTASACALLGCFFVSFVHVPYAVRVEAAKIIGTFVVAVLFIRIQQKGLKIGCCHRTVTSMSNPWKMTVNEVTICVEYKYGFRGFKAANASEFNWNHDTTHTPSAAYDQKAYLWGKFHQVIAEDQYLLTAILETAEETNVNVLGLTTRWNELVIPGGAGSESKRSEE